MVTGRTRVAYSHAVVLRARAFITRPTMSGRPYDYYCTCAGVENRPTDRTANRSRRLVLNVVL